MTNGTAQAGPTPKLPIVGTIVTAYIFVFRHFGPLARAAVVPFVVTMLADLRLLWAEQEQSMLYSARLLWFILPFIATIPFATQCHRFFLDPTPANRPRFGFPWSRRETVFTLHAVGLFILLSVLSAVLLPLGDRMVSMGGGSANGTTTLVVISALIFVLMTYILARLVLVLPAAAVGRPLGWAAAWRRAAHHGVGLALIVILAPLPWLVPSIVQMLAGSEVAGIWRFVITTAIIEACGLISMAIVMVALAAAYRWIMGDTGAVVPAGGA